MGKDEETTAGIACARCRLEATSAAPDPSVKEELPDEDGSEGTLNPLGSVIAQLGFDTADNLCKQEWYFSDNNQACKAQFRPRNGPAQWA